MNTLTFNTDGTALISGSADKSIKIWDTRSHQLLQHYAAHDDSVTSISLHPVRVFRAWLDSCGNCWLIALEFYVLNHSLAITLFHLRKTLPSKYGTFVRAVCCILCRATRGLSSMQPSTQMVTISHQVVPTN